MLLYIKQKGAWFCELLAKLYNDMQVKIINDNEIALQLTEQEAYDYDIVAEDFIENMQNPDKRGPQIQKIMNIIMEGISDVDSNLAHKIINGCLEVRLNILTNGSLIIYVRNINKDAFPQLQNLFNGQNMSQEDLFDNEDFDDDDIIDPNEEFSKEDFINTLDFLHKLFNGQLTDKDIEDYQEQHDKTDAKNSNVDKFKFVFKDKKRKNLKNVSNVLTEKIDYNFTFSFKDLNDLINFCKGYYALCGSVDSIAYNYDDEYLLIISRSLDAREFQQNMFVIAEFYEPQKSYDEVIDNVSMPYIQEHHKDDILIKEKAVEKLASI